MATTSLIEYPNKGRNNFRDRLYSSYTQTVGSLPSWPLQRMLWQYGHIWRNWLPQDKKTSILDVGCGGGQFLLYLKNSGFTSLYGVDASQDQIAIARQSSSASVSCGYASEYLESYKSFFGVVSAQNVLEHLDRDKLLNMLDAIHSLVTCGFSDIEFRELRPQVRGAKSLVRFVLWMCIRSILHLWRIVEFGGVNAPVYTDDMQVIAKKAWKKS